MPGATETELMPKHFGRKAYGRTLNDLLLLLRKAFKFQYINLAENDTELKTALSQNLSSWSYTVTEHGIA